MQSYKAPEIIKNKSHCLYSVRNTHTNFFWDVMLSLNTLLAKFTCLVFRLRVTFGRLAVSCILFCLPFRWSIYWITPFFRLSVHVNSYVRFCCADSTALQSWWPRHGKKSLHAEWLLPNNRRWSVLATCVSCIYAVGLSIWVWLR